VRIISAAYPPVHVFEELVTTEDLDHVLTIRALADESLFDTVGSRFAPPGGYGVYYTAKHEDTAVAETVYHREQDLRSVNAPAMDVDQRVLKADIKGSLYDLRGVRDKFADLYSPSDYTISQKAGSLLRDAGADGIIYDSVRHKGGTCAALFEPRIVLKCRHVKYLTYRWDGSRITGIFEIRRVRQG
jgi:hypothetical protein